jgi:hypothetical protein
MRSARGDVGETTFFTQKTTTDLRIGPSEHCSVRDVQHRLSRDFPSRSIFDFCSSIDPKRTSDRS